MAPPPGLLFFAPGESTLRGFSFLRLNREANGVDNPCTCEYSVNMTPNRPRLRRCVCCDGSGSIFEDAELGAWFRQARRDCDMTLREVAAIIGFDYSYVSKLEQGKARWNLDLERRYAAAINMSPR